MKSYTDLEQSKKLAEFLPLESADMVLLHEEPYETSDSKFDGLHQALCVPFNKYDKSWRQKYKNIYYFPCWSLAALLNILHSRQDDIPSLSGGGYKDGNYTPDWCLDYEFDNGDYQKTFADNPVDVCYEMIVKLHKMNLL